MDDFSDVNDLVKTTKGAPSIVFEGYTCRKDKSDPKGQYHFWRCRHKGCPGRLTSDAEMKRAKQTKPHQGHLPNKKVGQAAKVVEKIKEWVVNEKIPVNRIYREEMKAVADDKEALQRIPTFAHMESAFTSRGDEHLVPFQRPSSSLKSPSNCNILKMGKGFSSTKSRETRF